jgi:hypothetical protein
LDPKNKFLKTGIGNLGVALGVLELDGLLLALLGDRLRPADAEEEDLLASRLLPGQKVLRLLPWGPTCCLRFGHAVVRLGPTSGILASRDGIEDFQNLGPPRGPTSLLFLCRCGTSQHACGAIITLVCSKGRVDEGRSRGSHDTLLLDLAGFTEASG